MNTGIIFGHLKSEQHNEALDSDQGLDFVYTFGIEREHEWTVII